MDKDVKYFEDIDAAQFNLFQSELIIWINILHEICGLSKKLVYFFLKMHKVQMLWEGYKNLKKSPTFLTLLSKFQKRWEISSHSVAFSQCNIWTLLWQLCRKLVKDLTKMVWKLSTLVQVITIQVWNIPRISFVFL